MSQTTDTLEQVRDDLLNMRAKVSDHMTNALFEIDRAIQAIQRSIDYDSKLSKQNDHDKENS